MKKRTMLSTAGAVGAISLTASYFLKDKSNREKLKQGVRKVPGKLGMGSNDETFEDAGAPDQSGDKDLAQFENAKMVSEGSQFGVQYYNEHKNNNEIENQQK
ncbi:protein YbyB [Oceanobacillus picturae]|jgi:hypothetical protein|uniref:Protein YbyB n=1 Tax=Oceanobacillus picturae TaxID=171693 RepID=W9A9C0_9BACI|nr:hypothetical protein [Oceanobacillus picturae]RIU96493.1 hypothetical protein D1864_02325 [Oceanobacillus picturae]GAQ18795.1 protein YbyB [Oceanobacillus picturae]CDO02364.1 hypothetical protein BN988_00825 [Oceanobacillus picturae]